VATRPYDAVPINPSPVPTEAGKDPTEVRQKVEMSRNGVNRPTDRPDPRKREKGLPDRQTL